MITLFGATGTTGTLIAKVLAREGLAFRLAGRSPDRLAALSAQLPGAPGWVVADVMQPDTLASLFKDGTRLLINCAGPFTDLGERVVSLAALNGVHYLDTTNELSFRIRAQGYNELARKNGAAVVPACAFEVAPADCMAAQIGQEWGAAEYDRQRCYTEWKARQAPERASRPCARWQLRGWLFRTAVGKAKSPAGGQKPSACPRVM